MTMRKEQSEANHAFIAASRNALPRLLAYIDRLEAVASAARSLAEDYKMLADSGDCGNWTCEEDVEEYGVLMSALEALDT